MVCTLKKNASENEPGAALAMPPGCSIERGEDKIEGDIDDDQDDEQRPWRDGQQVMIEIERPIATIGDPLG